MQKWVCSMFYTPYAIKTVKPLVLCICMQNIAKISMLNHSLKAKFYSYEKMLWKISWACPFNSLNNLASQVSLSCRVQILASNTEWGGESHGLARHLTLHKKYLTCKSPLEMHTPCKVTIPAKNTLSPCRPTLFANTLYMDTWTHSSEHPLDKGKI